MQKILQRSLAPPVQPFGWTSSSKFYLGRCATSPSHRKYFRQLSRCTKDHVQRCVDSEVESEVGNLQYLLIMS